MVNRLLTELSEDDRLKKLQHDFGKEQLYFANLFAKPLEVFSTGSLKIDELLEINGWPKGRIIEIFGNESSGKSTICLQTISCLEKEGGRAAYIDAEYSFDNTYAQKLGLNLDSLILCKPKSGEQAFMMIDGLIKSEIVDLIIVDSVAALVPESELNAKISEQSMGLHARLMSKGLRMIQASVWRHNVTVIFINQVRERVGNFYGSHEMTTGGKALKFFASIRLETRKSEVLKDEKGTINGVKLKLTTVKNKLGAPLKSVFVDLLFNQGIDNIAEVIELAIKARIIEQKGSWYRYLDHNLAQGINNLRQLFLDQQNQFYLEILEKLKARKRVKELQQEQTSFNTTEKINKVLTSKKPH